MEILRRIPSFHKLSEIAASHHETLDGSADAVYHALVDAPSTGSLLRRVAPGAPEGSFLYMKLAEETPPSGARMPEAAAPLDACEIEAVKSWIAAGAARN